MGWGSGEVNGKDVGYTVSATCEHPGCKKKIDRGLSYACGGMHGKYAQTGDMEVCEGYFCSDHLWHCDVPGEGVKGGCVQLCNNCRIELLELKVEAFKDALLEVLSPVPHPHSDFHMMATPIEHPTPDDHRRRGVYETLIQWSDGDGVIPLDGRYMTKQDCAELRAIKDRNALIRGHVIMGTPATPAPDADA